MQRSGISTIKYHTWPRIPMVKWQTHSYTPQTRAKRSALSQQVTTRHKLTDAHKGTRNTRQKKHKRSTKEVAQWLCMVKPTISTVIAKTVSKAFYLYISSAKLTRKYAKHKLPYADTRVSQIPSASMTFRIELWKTEYKLKTPKSYA